jgi:hypothetical protein
MTITVTPTVDASNLPPRIKLAVAASAGETSTTVTRSDPSGAWIPVRTNDGNPLQLSAGSGLLYAYEVPFGQSTTFSSVQSPGTVSAAVTLNSSAAWLVHVGQPALSVSLTFRPGSLQEESYSVMRGVFRPLGRVHPIIVTDGARSGPSSSLVVDRNSLVDVSAFKALLADASTLLLNIPPSLGTGFDTSYIAIDTYKIGRLTDLVIDENRDFLLPFDVVDRPLGGQQPQRTLADLMSYATLADLNSHYATLNDLYVGP